MLAGLADDVGRDRVVARVEVGVGHHDGHRDEGLITRVDARIAGLVDAVAVEVRDAFHTGLVGCEHVEDLLPQGSRDPDLGLHAASAWTDGPAYAGLISAVWIRVRVASRRSTPSRQRWLSVGLCPEM